MEVNGRTLVLLRAACFQQPVSYVYIESIPAGVFFAKFT